ncbi:MAG: ribbon-helix-helix domain-containing protein [Oscillospiraceae bacterium]|jgi:metal-responsive CopG/Arc/MetJ family transcriptional regulator|nr:ribbon-helix-helix domain-containing protein [Oscillospiraceae bacterium]
MPDKINITTKKPKQRGEDGHRVISVRIKNEVLAQLDEISGKTNRSRNELINLLIVRALENVKVEE